MPDLSLIHDASQSDVVLELLQSNLNRILEGTLSSCRVVHKLDLDQPNHLSPINHKGRPMLQLFFDNVSQLTEAREQLRGIVQSAQTKRSQYTFSMDPSQHMQTIWKDPLQLLTEMREYDVPYVVRVCTDMDIRCGTWYTVQVSDTMLMESDNHEQSSGGVALLDADRESKAEPTFLAFDIECTKAPLKFPSADIDEIFMISYMVSTPTGGQGYLITSRSVVSQDVGDFEYTPKPNYPGPFHIFNETDEKALLERFFEEYRKHRPHIVVTYNGDFFDWPFVDTRAKHHGINMFERTGVEEINGQYCGRSSVHLDAFHWVQRDSYLPQGAQGLKAVTRYKLGYDPVEVDPEDMLRMAQEKPVHMATYSVSDAVSTFYLHEKYVHLFIFSLCTIIPMGPEDVLRKGSGTLCEALLMVQACQKGIICPNKQADSLADFHQGHLLESETYIGGKVECLEAGVYRSDLEYDFDLKPAAFDQLIGNVDRDLRFAIEVEGDKRKEDILNYEEVIRMKSKRVAHVLTADRLILIHVSISQIRSKIIVELEGLRDRPKRKERPYVYHL
jgi:DNA polymerase epsilon subunit 1